LLGNNTKYVLISQNSLCLGKRDEGCTGLLKAVKSNLPSDSITDVFTPALLKPLANPLDFAVEFRIESN
jgi:hypothetical protein